MGSLEEADKKIDELAASGRLDPALLLMMAKAYAGSKETDYTREEVGGVRALRVRCRVAVTHGRRSCHGAPANITMKLC